MKPDEMQRYYDKRAPEYEQIYFRDDRSRRQEIDDEAARVEKLVAGQDVLELACGTGYWTEIIARTASSLHASDLSEQMIAEAKQKDYRIDVAFQQADLYTADFGQDRFDRVMLGFWFSHHPRQDFDRLFDILIKPLKPTGQIWMIDNNPSAEGPTNVSVGRDEHGNNYKKRTLDNGEEYTILKNYFDRDELQRLLSPRFDIHRLTYGQHYWAVVLRPKP